MRKERCCMNTFLEKIVDNTLSFFFDKRANKLFSKVQTTYEYNILKSKIQNYSKRYFEEQFYHIPVVEEFDFDGLNNFLHENFLEKIIPCFNAPDYKQRLFFIEQLYRQSYEYARATDCRKQNVVRAYVNNILNIIQEDFMQKIDDKKILLSNHIVDQIRVSVQEMLQKLELNLKNNGLFVENINSDFNIKNQYSSDEVISVNNEKKSIKKRNIVNHLYHLYQSYPENKEIALVYANSLLVLSAEQKPYIAKDTINQLCYLYQSFPESEEIVLAYANSLLVLIDRQILYKEAKNIINQLCYLYQSYPENEEIALIYAKGLILFSSYESDK